ncbi:hypothetical protein ABZ806_44805 [Spirillospora sp. NPDC047418]
MSPRLAAVITLAVMVPVTALLVLMSTTLAPDQVTFTARWLCDAPYTDPFVVSEHVGRGTDISMYCTTERGGRQDAGWLTPLLIMWAVYYLVLAPLTSLTIYSLKPRY